MGGVAFVNPDATKARMRRRTKLAASRARLLALASQGEGGGSGTGSAGDREMRKQQRMLRNRESAALSRKRRSDRIDELEIQVEHLEEENRRLRRRLNHLELHTSATCGGDTGAEALRVSHHAQAEHVEPAAACEIPAPGDLMAQPSSPGMGIVTNCSFQDHQTVATTFSRISDHATVGPNNVLLQPAVIA